MMSFQPTNMFDPIIGMTAFDHRTAPSPNTIENISPKAGVIGCDAISWTSHQLSAGDSEHDMGDTTKLISLAQES